jgi:hypothetical protein
MQGAGALGVVAAMAVGVAALTAGGTAGPGAQRIQAANPTPTIDTSSVPNPSAPVTTAPAPAPADDTSTPPPSTPPTSETPVVEAPATTVPAPTVATISGHVSNIPEGATLTLSLSGSNGTFTAVADPAGDFSVGGVPTGEYTAMYEWVSSDGTATQAGRLGGVTVTGDLTVNFSL